MNSGSALWSRPLDPSYLVPVVPDLTWLVGALEPPQIKTEKRGLGQSPKRPLILRSALQFGSLCAFFGRD